MKIILAVLLLLFTSFAYADGLVVEDINVEQINKSLPPNWYISTIGYADAPIGWSKINGDNGIAITVSRTPYSYKLSGTKSKQYLEVYHPKFRFCIMPNNFSGKSGNDTIFKEGKFNSPKNPPIRAMLILNHAIQLDNFYIFYSKTSFADWKKPEELFDKLVIDNKNL